MGKNAQGGDKDGPNSYRYGWRDVCANWYDSWVKCFEKDCAVRNVSTDPESNLILFNEDSDKNINKSNRNESSGSSGCSIDELIERKKQFSKTDGATTIKCPGLVKNFSFAGKNGNAPWDDQRGDRGEGGGGTPGVVSFPGENDQEFVPYFAYWNMQQCPTVACKGEWSEWSKCSKSCGGGVKTRYYKIDKLSRYNGEMCEGKNGERQVESCNTQSCDEDCEYSEWTPWSSCDQDKCQIKRTRTITKQATGEGQKCNNITVEVKPCDTDRCKNKTSELTKEFDKDASIANAICPEPPMVKYSEISEKPNKPYKDNDKVIYSCNNSDKMSPLFVIMEYGHYHLIYVLLIHESR